MREFDREIVDLKGHVALTSFARPGHLKHFAEHLGCPYVGLADPERNSYQSLGLCRGALRAIAPPRAIWAIYVSRCTERSGTPSS